MFGLDKLALIAGAITGAVLAGAVAIPIAYHLGRHDGRQAAALAALEASVKTLRSRNQIDDEISAADAARLCSDFGLPDGEVDECVRRLEQAASEP